jgi:hypothetical protein
MLDGELAAPAAADPSGREVHAYFRCVGGRGQIDDAAASIIAFALRQSGSEPNSRRHGNKVFGDGKEGSVTIHLICYASHPSEAVRRYTLRQADSARRRRAGPPSRHRLRRGPCARAAGPADTFAGDVAALCRLAGQHAVTVGARLGAG